MKSHVLQVSWKELVLISLAGLGLGWVFGTFGQILAIGWFWSYFLAFFAGQGGGMLAHRLVKYKMGPSLIIAIVVSALVGMGFTEFDLVYWALLDMITGDLPASAISTMIGDDLLRGGLFLVGLTVPFQFRR
jgi:membrane-bound acyltransferase YfiQ involved in biofilm formation